MQFHGFLFDLDGTLINSLELVERAWRAWAARHGLNSDEVMAFIHGRPAKESVGHLLENASEQEIEAEFRWLERVETEDTEGVVALPGAAALLNRLNELGVAWAIVTSGSDPVAKARIQAAGLPMPKVLITANQVSKGKPDPEPFRLGAQRLGLAPQHCMVVEDAPAGVAAGKAAGAVVLALDTHYDQQTLAAAHHVISSLEQLQITGSEGDFRLVLLDKVA